MPAALSSFDQCQNQTLPYTQCSGWTNGGLNNSNHYAEDMVVPQRAVFAVSPGIDYVFSVTYDDINGTKHGYDYLAKWNYSITGASPCQSLVASLCSGAPSTFDMVSDPTVLGGSSVASHELAQTDRVWTLYGGVISAATQPTHASGQATTTVTFHANPGVSSVVLLFGGHLAVGTPSSAARSWGNGNGASAYPGGSLSIRQTGSSRNNGINTNAIAPLPVAAFTITKTATPTTAAPGTQVTYKVTVTNTGGQSGTATFTDDYDNNLTSVSTPAGCTAGTGSMTCTTNSLAPSASQTFTYTANLPTTFSNPGTGCGTGQFAVTNTATFAAGTNVTVNTGPASATVCVNASSSFSVVKTPRTPTAAAGGNVIYDVVVTNNGSAPGSTSFTDNYDDAASTVTLPSNCTDTTAGTDKKFTCTTGTINPGGSETITYTMKMPATFTGSPSTTCTNGGYAVLNQITGAAGTANAKVCVTASPTFSVVKTPRTTTASAGGNVIYDVVVSNTGSGPGSTSFTDNYNDAASTVTLPSNCTDTTAGTDKKFTCTTGTINPGGSETITYTMKMPATFTGTPTGCDNGGYPVINQVTGAAGTASAKVCVNTSATFTVTKTPRTNTAAAGGNVIYDVVVSNTGSGPGSTSFTDNYNDAASTVTLPSNCTDTTAGTDKKFTCTTGTINPGGSETITYTMKMPATFTGSPIGCTNGGYPVINQVTGAAGTASSTVCVTASPTFSVVKTPRTNAAAAGSNVIYDVVVSNTGSGPGSTSFTDNYNDAASTVTLPSNCTDTTAGTDKKFTCTTGTINPGGTETITYTMKMPASFTGTPTGCDNGGYPVINQVTGAAGTASSTVCVTASPTFSVVKTPRTSTAAAGGNVIYDAVVSNTGSGPGSTSFTDNYDDAASTVTLPSNCTDTTAGTDKKFTCTTGTINPGGSETITYTMKMPATFTGSPGTTCTNGGYPVLNQVSGAAGTAGSTVCVTASPSFSITKEPGSPTAAANGTVTYTVTVSNNGSGPGSTSFTDNYDDNATAVTPLAPGCVDSTVGTDKKFTCTTGTINPGQSQVFTYDIKMPATFTGTPTGCDNGDFPVTNTATLASGGDPATAKVCVDASPSFTLKKTPRSTTATAGGNVTYDVVVTNNGSAPGATSFTDNYNDNASTVTLPSNCVDATVGTDKKFTCTTGTINPGGTETVTYTLKMPATFTGTPSGCDNGGYPVNNTVTVTGSSSDSATVCVAAAPQMSIVKTGSVAFTSNGDQIITYTINYANTGPAEANAVTITDQLPVGTAFSFCSGSCTTAGSPTTVTWSVAPIAPLTGTGSVQLKVRVTTNQTCSITNTAVLKLGGVTAATSDPSVVNVTPVADPTTAKSNGSAIGVQVKAKGVAQLAVGLLNAILTGSGNNQTLLIGQASSSQTGPGGPATNAASVLTLNLTGIISAGVIRETSASVVTASPAETRQTSTSEVASVCLVPVAGVCTVKSDTVRAVASTMANGSFAAVSSAGSTIEHLYVAGVLVPVDLNQTTKIPLNAGLFGKDSYVAINERTSSAGLVNNRYAADMTVSMIHVKITNLALVGALDVVVAQATAHSDFPKTLVCGGGTHQQAVSGHALAAKLYTGPLLADLTQGFVQISPLGGAESQHIVGMVVPSTGVAVNAQVADTSSAGSFNATSSSAQSWAEVAGDGTKPACVLQSGPRCVVEATVIRAQANSVATSAGSTSTDAGSQLLGLAVATIPINANAAPNTVIPLAGLGFVILNEQFCDNGASATHSCSAAGHSGITVRAVRIVITVANNILHLDPGIELIVSEAHADSTYN